MKKALSLILAAAVSLSVFSGCASSKKTLSTESGNTASTKKLTIGIVQIVQHHDLDNIRQGFIDELKTKGYENNKNITIDYENAQGDQSTLKTICNKFASKKYDLIMAIATPSAQAAAAETKDIPILYSAVTDPVSAGLIKDAKKPGGNITGTSDVIEVSRIFDMAGKITPGKKTIGAVYNSSEANSISVMKEVQKYADSHGMKLISKTVTNASEISQAATSLVGKADMMFVPIDNTVASAMASISDVAKKAKIPLYVSADTMVIDGGLATYGVKYDDLGKQTADMAVQILKGTKPGDIPAKFMYNDHVYVNQKTADAIGVKIPADILKTADVIK